MPQMTNWTEAYDSQTLAAMYQEIHDYFDNEGLKEVLVKYDKEVDFTPSIV